jgi:vacuolar-type H+-ATPase subunit E/Vma4
MGTDSKGYSIPNADMSEVMAQFEIESCAIQFRKMVTDYVEAEMKGRERDADHYRKTLMQTMEALMSVLGGHIVEMKVHGGARITREFVELHLSHLAQIILQTVRQYEESGRCPSCGPTH